LTLAVIVSFTYGIGIWSGTLRADDVAVRTIEKALRTAEASRDDYAVDMVTFLLGCVLLLRGAEGDRDVGLDLLASSARCGYSSGMA
jgi:adenylate cyclase